MFTENLVTRIQLCACVYVYLLYVYARVYVCTSVCVQVLHKV